MTRLLEMSTHFFAWVAATAIAAIAGLVALAAFMRYAASAPIKETDELVGLFFFLTCFLAVSHCTVTGRQIAVTLLSDRFTGIPGKLAKIASAGATVFFLAWMGYLSIDFVNLSIIVGARSDMAQILLWPFMIFMPIMLIYLIIVTLVTAFAKVESHHDEDGDKEMWSAE